MAKGGRPEGAARLDVRGRRRARRALVQAIYQWQMNAAGAAALISEYAANGTLKNADRPFFEEILAAVVARRDELDGLYEGVLDRDRERLDGVELAILRLGVCELKCREDVPAPVVIDEYVELAKLFGGQDSHKYINGVLDKVAGQLRPGELTEALAARDGSLLDKAAGPLRPGHPDG